MTCIKLRANPIKRCKCAGGRDRTYSFQAQQRMEFNYECHLDDSEVVDIMGDQGSQYEIYPLRALYNLKVAISPKHLQSLHILLRRLWAILFTSLAKFKMHLIVTALSFILATTPANAQSPTSSPGLPTLIAPSPTPTGNASDILTYPICAVSLRSLHNTIHC